MPVPYANTVPSVSLRRSCKKRTLRDDRQHSNEQAGNPYAQAPQTFGRRRRQSTPRRIHTIVGPHVRRNAKDGSLGLGTLLAGAHLRRGCRARLHRAELGPYHHLRKGRRLCARRPHGLSAAQSSERAGRRESPRNARTRRTCAPSSLRLEWGRRRACFIFWKRART